jgi:ABC-type Fe3+-hydroxamate transport system substrate-binding protein
MIRHLFTITIISTIALLAPERTSAQEAGIMLASPAPAASVVTLDGREVDLASYIGKKPVAVAAYKVPHTSYLVVVDAGGKVVYTGVGAEQNVKGAIARALAPANGMSHDGM